MTAPVLPKLVGLDEVSRRLATILPSTITGKAVVCGPVATKVVWVALYCGAVDRRRYIRPTMVCWMRPAIADDTSSGTRHRYWDAASRRQQNLFAEFPAAMSQQAWYADNTREVIRDDVLRYGLWELGAVLRDESQPTNSSRPVWTLTSDFAALFDPDLTDSRFDFEVKAWQKDNLTGAAAARQRAAQLVHTSAHEVAVTLPDGASRTLGAGRSSIIARGVVEMLAPRLLRNPRVVALSEGREHVSESDRAQLNELGLQPKADRVLPDIVLLDQSDRTLWCIEVVATDGPINEMRRRDLVRWASGGGFDPDSIRFVTAFESRTHDRFRALVSTLAPGTGAWFLDEPELMVWLSPIGGAI